jgi:hypothetical protein
MGTYSFYLTSRNNAAGCKINWQAMNRDKLFKFRPLKKSYTIISNLEELAEEFDETKLFGYHTEELMDALNELAKGLEPYGCFPRLYFKWEGANSMICYEFIPGSHFNVSLLEYKDGDELCDLPEKQGWYSV